MKQTKVQCTCVSKKQKQNWDPKNPVAHEIELEVPYDQNSVYWKLSGGTNMVLNTVNNEAADMFVLGSKYDLLISPSEE